MKKRGSVLVQVLMTSVVVAIIAAGIMQMMLMRSQTIARAQQRTEGTVNATSAFNTILNRWAETKTICASGVPGMSGGTSTTPPGTCNCSYTATSSDGTALTICAGAACPAPNNSTSPCQLAVTNTPYSP